MIRRIVDTDLEAVQAMLIDLDVPKDAEAAEAAARDQDVILPDNMLPDGTLLDAEMYQRQSELLAGLTTKKIWAKDKSNFVDESGNSQSFSVRYADDTSGTVEVERMTLDGKTVLIPQTLDTAATDVVVTPDGSKAIAYTERDMWLTSAVSRGSSSVLPQTYNGKSYDDLADASFEMFGTNYALWCGQVTPSPDSKMVAYVSNKDELNGLSVFIYNFETEQEQLLVGNSDCYYLIIDWVDNGNILCYKMRGNSKETVVVSTDGTETALEFEVENPSIISCNNGLLAYMPAAEADAVYVGRFTNGGIEPVFSSQLDGTLRIRPGINLFSPDGTQLAVIYVPNSAPSDRIVKVFNLTDQTAQDISAVKSRSALNTCILEVSWIDDSSLLTVVVQDESEELSTYTTWRYALNGGEDNA